MNIGEDCYFCKLCDADLVRLFLHFMNMNAVESIELCTMD